MHYRYLIAFAHDLLWVPLAVFLALWLRFNFGDIPPDHLRAGWLLIALAVPSQAIAYAWARVNRGIWRYVSMPDALNIARAVIAGVSVSYLLAFVLFRLQALPRSVIVLYPLLLLAGLLASRVLYRGYREHRLNLRHEHAQRVLLVGGGRAGELLLREMQKSGNYVPVGILDDDTRKQGQEILGTRVLAGTHELSTVLRDIQPDLLVLAIPSATKALKNKVLKACEAANVRLLVLPGLEQLVSDTVHLSTLRKVEIEDLLGRTPARPDTALMSANVRGKVVMLTGAGGSIGSEIARQVLRYRPSRIVLLESSEFALYRIERELRQQCAQCDMTPDILPLLGSVVDGSRVERVCRAFGVQTLYHAAAYKHVPLVEYNPGEAITNNVFGTLHTAQAAQRAGVERFVLISTDKAVRPTNVMGASKRFAEMVLQALSAEGGNTCFAMVRFGNVLGSSGSVVPLFRQQIQAGGPVTVTHPDITRYFMSIPEAAQLVIQAGAMAEGGDVFILDMGEPVKIVDLARQMIQLSGLSVRDDDHPDGDIAIEFSGLRPGEKLYEELLIGDAVSGTQHPLIMRACDDFLPWKEMKQRITALQTAVASHDIQAIRQLLLTTVKGYAPQCESADLLLNKGAKHAESG